MRVRSQALFAAAFAFAGGSFGTPLPLGAADATPTVAAILAHVRRAAGIRPAAFRETIDSVSDGTAARVVTLRSGDDYRTDVTEGALHSAFGTIGAQPWRQNENGETIRLVAGFDPAGLHRVDPSALAGTVTPIAAPVAGYLIAELDASGYGVKRYVEAATWHVVRVDEIRASGTRVTTYDDFRTVAGYTTAFHIVASGAVPGDGFEAHVAEIVPSAVDRNALAVPPDARIFVEFPAGVTSVALPVREDHQKFIVRVTIGSRGLDFILDTGASGIVLDEGVAKQLGLTSLATHVNDANAGRFKETTTTVPEMHVGALVMHDAVVRTVPAIEDEGQLGDYRAVGLLGYDFIAGTALKLDYFNGKVTAYPPASFAPPTIGDGFDLDVDLDDGTPETPVIVNGERGDRFIMDTGSYGSLIFTDAFVREHPHALVDEGHGAGRDVRLRGMGGSLDIVPYQLAKVKIGTVTFHDFVAYAIRNKAAYDTGDDGVIGPAFLSLFDVYLDYRHAKTYLIFNST